MSSNLLSNYSKSDKTQQFEFTVNLSSPARASAILTANLCVQLVQLVTVAVNVRSPAAVLNVAFACQNDFYAKTTFRTAVLTVGKDPSLRFGGKFKFK